MRITFTKAAAEWDEWTCDQAASVTIDHHRTGQGADRFVVRHVGLHIATTRTLRGAMQSARHIAREEVEEAARR